MTSFVLPLDAPQASLERVGGKGASLAKLAMAGLPVPGGFHVTTNAYRAFVEANDLEAVIEHTLETVDPERPVTLEEASRTIRQAFVEGSIPVPLTTAITEAYRDLPGSDPSVAVRSSATAEDLPEASFAGQLESYLDVSGEDGVLDATRKCWGSLWTARAIGYRDRQGIGHAGAAVGVVVQELVDADIAGILFTENPLGGPAGRALVSASWGLGDAVVGGRVTPDEYIVDTQTGAVVDRRISAKEVMTVAVGGGTEDQPVPDDRRTEPVLADIRLAELTELGREIESLFGTPMDVEWALHDGTFSILQARPITVLAPTVEDVEWETPRPGTRYIRASVIDFMPNPISPLFETMGLPIYGASLKGSLAELTGRGADYIPDDFVRTIRRYAYMRVDFTLRQWLGLLFVMTPKLFGAIRRGPSHYRDVAFPAYRAEVKRLSVDPVSTMSAPDLWANARQLTAAAAHHLSVLQVDTLGASAGSEGLFTVLYERFLQRPGDPRAAEFVMGYDTTPIRTEKSTFDLAAWARSRPDLARYLIETPTPHIRAAMNEQVPPEGVPAEDWTEWLGRIDVHQEQFGHVLYDFDFAWPVPAEDVRPVVASTRMFLRGEGSDPYARQQRLESARIRATDSLLSRASGLRGWAVRTALGWAQSLAEVREDSIASVGLAYPRLRKVLLELGGRLADRGVIESPDDVVWLEASEIDASLDALEGDGVVTARNQEITARREEAAAAERLVPPVSVPPTDRYMGMPLEFFIPGQGRQAGGTLEGVGASPGRVTGTAKVLHGPEDFDQMERDSILVAKVTTPAWTPLFAMAGGIVTDIGGPLSHGSIVAREYGIPAVLGTATATRLIRSGQRITVDGDAGLVTVLDEG
jgi:pyruvate,water dikinase